jgi:integrase
MDRHRLQPTTVHIKRGKDNKDRIVPISAKTLIVLKRYREIHPSMDYYNVNAHHSAQRIQPPPSAQKTGVKHSCIAITIRTTE